MSLESSASLWDAISFWFVAVGAALAFVGAVASVPARRTNRRLAREKEEIARREKHSTDRAIAEANARAAEANQKAEEERLARIQIEQRLAPRILGNADLEDLLRQLSKFAGQAIDVFAYDQNREVVGIASPLIAALKAARWSVLVETGAEGRVVSGMLVEVSSDASPASHDAANALVSALRSKGLTVAGPTPKTPSLNLMSIGPANFDKAPVKLTIGAK